MLILRNFSSLSHGIKCLNCRLYRKVSLKGSDLKTPSEDLARRGDGM